MATDFQVKRERFNSMANEIKAENIDFFRGKTLSKVFMIGKSSDDNPALLFPKNDVPDDIKEKLNNAFKTVFLED